MPEAKASLLCSEVTIGSPAISFTPVERSLLAAARVAYAAIPDQAQHE